MSALAVTDVFYVSGGTMPEEALSYVERAADRHLLNSLLDGKFCYVLNSRQMGKSSMCVRTKRKLEEDGVRTAFIDLTKIGGKNVTAEQWYAGLIVEVGRAVGLRTELLDYWRDNSHLSPMQRLFGGIREVVLEKVGAPVVVFVDEIDSTRSLPFDTDEFFAGIRECYNRRVHDRVYNRLTFCLLGVAVPSDLIRNAQTTPFNIGERVYLKDFTLEEVSCLARGLPGRESLVNRIHYWTHGHPFLTQSICTAIRNDASIKTDADVDALVSRELFEPKARETNINLADVGNRVLNGCAEGDDIAKFRADILSAYEKALTGKTVLQDDESNRTTAVLKLSGLMRSEGKSLLVRNPIYQRVFGREWIHENMPGQELRRQRKAFLLGVLRTSVVAGIIVAVIATLAVRVDQLYHEANRERDRANYEVYVADMNLMPDLWKRGDIERMRLLLNSTANSINRGWEWAMWNRLAHLSSKEMSDASNFALSPDGSQLLVRGTSGIRLVDAKTFRVLANFPSKLNQFNVAFLPDGKRGLEIEGSRGAYIYDLSTTKLIATVPNVTILSGNRSFSPEGTWALGVDGDDLPVKVDLIHYKSEPIADQNTGIRWRQLSPSGKLSIWTEEYSNTPGKRPGVSVRATDTWQEVARFPVDVSAAVAINPDEKHALIGDRFGSISYWDIATGKQLWKIKPYSDTVQRIEFTNDGKTVSTVGRERFGKVFRVDVKGATLVRTYPDAGNTMISPSGDRVYFAYWTLRAYDLPGESDIQTVAVPANAQNGNIFADGTLVVGTPSGVIYKLNVLNDRTPKLIWDGRRPFNGYDGQRDMMAVLSTARGYDVLKAETNELVGTVDVDQKRFYPMSPYPKSAKLLIGGNHKVQTWDFAKRTLSVTYDAGSQSISNAKVSPDESLLAVGLNTGDIVLKSLANGVIRQIPDHLAATLSMHFSTDGKLLLVTADDDTASVVDVSKGVVILKLVGHSQSVNDIDISPDGRRIATGADDGTARIWDTTTGRELTLLDVGGEVLSVRFLRDGKSLVSVARGGTVKLWTTDNSWKPK